MPTSPLYADRKLAEGYPELDRLAFQTFSRTLEPHLSEDEAGLERQLGYLERLVELRGRRVLVLGCGPKPRMVRFLLERGYDAVGVEPVPSFVRSAIQFVGAPERVLAGTAEQIPVEGSSQDLVYCNSVLEHVDSPASSLAEMHRVLKPGGIAYVITTNRHRLSLVGHNGEFNLPFYNWLPKVVKESFTFQHLHYRPELANFSERPAVHWPTFAELCDEGRRAGFAQFYSPLDLVDAGDPPVANSWLKRTLLARVQTNPWLRASALSFTRFGGMVIMLKRKVAAAVPTGETHIREVISGGA